MVGKEANLRMLLDQIRAHARDLYPTLVAIRRDLHQHPELSFEEFRTTARVKEILQEAGLRLLPLDLPTGALAEVGGSGPVVALRADIDALPVEEQAPVPFRSTVPGKMHACGHDFHTSVILGAGLILQRLQDQLPGTARLLFQPAEEVTGGAKQMIEAGALAGVSSILGFHNKPDLPVGTVGVKDGPLMAAVDGMDIIITGKGGHGALPHQTIDPIVAGSAVVMALQTAVSRSISPLDTAVVSVTAIHGGAAYNVIPDRVEMKGTIRTYNPEVRRRMPALLTRIVQEVAAGYGATGELVWTSGIPAVTNHPDMAALMREAAALLVGAENVQEAAPTTGGEDFALYQERVPGCYIWLGTGNEAEGITEDWHHPRFMVDERALETGAALFAYAAIQAMKQHP